MKKCKCVTTKVRKQIMRKTGSVWSLGQSIDGQMRVKLSKQVNKNLKMNLSRHFACAMLMNACEKQFFDLEVNTRTAQGTPARRANTHFEPRIHLCASTRINLHVSIRACSADNEETRHGRLRRRFEAKFSLFLSHASTSNIAHRLLPTLV